MAQLRKCPSCGHEIALNAWKCPHCGHSFASQKVSMNAEAGCLTILLVFGVPLFIFYIISQFVYS